MTTLKMNLQEKGTRLRHRLALSLAILLLSAAAAVAGPAPPSRWSFSAPSTLAGTANGEDWFYGVVPLEDGSYLAAGFTQLAGQTQISAVVAHVSATKTLIQEVPFSDPGGAVLFDITRTPNGFVAVGAAGGAVLVAGIDPNFVVTWQTFNAATLTPAAPPGSLEAHSVRPVPSGGVIAAGWIGSSGGPGGALLLRLDANLSPVPAAFPGGTGAILLDSGLQAKARSVRVETDSNGEHFILAGSARPTSSDPGDLYVKKVKADATSEWTVVLSKAQLIANLGYVETVRTSLCTGQPAQTLQEEADTAEVAPPSEGGGYIVATNVNFLGAWMPPSCSNPAITPSYVDLDIGLLRISPTGTPLWAKQIGRFSGIDFQTPLLLHDDGLIVIGNDATNLSQVKIAAIKTDFSGTLQWQGTYINGTDSNDCPFGAAVTPDGSIIVAGNNNVNGDDYLLLKIGPARDLWLHDETPDVGDEPNTTTGPLWVSPDIWVRTHQDFFPWSNAHQHENPEFRDPSLLVPNYVYAEVSNRGVEPASGVVHFYYAKASTGLVWPASWTGTPMCCGTVCGGEIGTATVTHLLPNTTQIVSVPWNPPNPADFATCGLAAEKGHFCLLARTETSSSSPTLGMAFQEGPSVNANTGANNNIVWKNVTIVDNFPGAGKTSDHFTFVHNVETRPAAVTLVFKAPREEQRDSIFKYAQIEIRLGPALKEGWLAGGRKMKGFIVEGDVLRITGNQAELQNILLKADQQEGLGIRLRSTAVRRTPARKSWSFDVQQVQNGQPVGGVRFTVLNKTERKPVPAPLPEPNLRAPRPGRIDPRDPLDGPGENAPPK